ncbi:hypothetical protein K438DRAFT_2126528 [Mycena galopus ATCC 62051]|nr:hypothetical protein K438DRAFT_2126528 [Mycena galopus ATCC 62051]
MSLSLSRRQYLVGSTNLCVLINFSLFATSRQDVEKRHRKSLCVAHSTSKGGVKEAGDKTGIKIQTVQPSPRSSSDWLGTLLLTARTVSTAAEAFPYLKGVTVKKNREALKGLCGNVMEIITIVRDQISFHGDTAAVKFRVYVVPSRTHGDYGYNFQVHKVLTVISPVDPPPPVKQGVNTCPPPSRVFHGRKPILNQMRSYFMQTAEKRQHIFLLHGLGGAGKTQIGLKFVQDVSFHILITSRNPGLGVHAGAHALVSDMEETEAVELLLKSAAQEITLKNKDIAADIVKSQGLVVFSACHNPSGSIHCKVRSPQQLLDIIYCKSGTTAQRKPTQSMMNMLGQWISEQIFSNALNMKPFLGTQVKKNSKNHVIFFHTTWDPSGPGSLNFMHITNELRAYSLITFNSETNTFRSIHLSTAGVENRLDTEPDFNLEFGSLYLYSARVQKAEQLQVASLVKHKKTLGEDHPETLKAMRNLANTYHKLGQFNDAKKLQTIVLEKQKTALGTDDPQTLMTWQKQILGEDHRNTIVSMSNLGWIFHSLDRLKEAEEIQSAAIEKGKRLLGHEDSLTIWTWEPGRKILGEDHPNALWTMGNLALTYKEQGHLKMAQEIQVVVLEKKKRILGDQHPETVRAKAELDSTCTALARFNGMR